MDTLAFDILEQGTRYRLPKYRVVDDKGIEATGDYTELAFIRGSTDPGAGIAKSDGILHETLLAMVIADLEYKHSLVPADEGARMLDHLRSALDAMHARTYRRKIRGVYCSDRK